jgi:hypothetical protein
MLVRNRWTNERHTKKFNIANSAGRKERQSPVIANRSTYS